MAYERLVSHLTKENLWLYILKMLNEKPTYPLDLKKNFHSRFHFKPATITFYVVLYKMEREGLVSVHREGGRKIYRCTDKGLKTLERGIELLEKTRETLSS